MGNIELCHRLYLPSFAKNLDQVGHIADRRLGYNDMVVREIDEFRFTENVYIRGRPRDISYRPSRNRKIGITGANYSVDRPNIEP